MRDLPGPQVTDSHPCSVCRKPMHAGENWACFRGELTPYPGIPGVFMQSHVHLHAGCAPPDRKLAVLQQMGHAAMAGNPYSSFGSGLN